MPSWYYDKADLKRTPSNQDNLDYETEQRYRREGARFIINVGTTMGLRYDTMATGVVYFHRFYMFHSFRTFPRYVTACCCLFLAGKVEETPKKCKDIIKTARSLLTDKHFAQFGEDPKEEVMTQERILLQTIKFDLQVDHPYSYLLKYAKALRGDKTKVQKLVQMAWTFVNDSLCTTLCLQWEPEIIAIALMYLASKLSKFEVLDWVGRSSKHARWWDMFVEDMSVELLEDICHQVLDLYSTPIPNTPRDSPPPSPPPTISSVKARPATPLPQGKAGSPIKVETHPPAAPTPVSSVLTSIPPSVVPMAASSAPLPQAPPSSRTPVATPVVIVGHPIPCLEEGTVKPPLPPPPPGKNVLVPPEPHLKTAAAHPPLMSPIQSIAPSVKFSYPPGSKTGTPKPPQVPPKEEPYSYAPPPPLPPPPGPPFTQTAFSESPKEPFASNPVGYRQPSQYYAGSETTQNQFYNVPEDTKQYYGPNGSANYPPSHSSRPYPDVYGSAPPGHVPSAHPPPGHGPPAHPPPAHAPPSHVPPPPPPPPGHVPQAHVPSGHIPPGHPPSGHGPPSHGPPTHGPPSHGPPGHIVPGHTGLVPPIRGPPGHPLGPYDDKPRPYLGSNAFPPGPRQLPNQPEGQYRYGHEPAAATGIPTVRITGRY